MKMADSTPEPRINDLEAQKDPGLDRHLGAGHKSDDSRVFCLTWKAGAPP
jgi:hypothetical protein